MSAHGFTRRNPRRSINGPSQPIYAPKLGLPDAKGAPFNCACMIEVTHNDETWRIPFPCFRESDGWHNARTGKLLTGEFIVTGYKLGEGWGNGR